MATNTDGFAEINYFDDSLTRVSHDAKFTLTDLSGDQGARRVEGNREAGSSWSRVENLSRTEGGYVVSTPVATPTATGTSFVVSCDSSPLSCVFTVVKGTVAVELSDGTTVVLRAGETITITADDPPGSSLQVVELSLADLDGDDWIQTNVELDEEHDTSRADDDESAGQGGLDVDQPSWLGADDHHLNSLVVAGGTAQ